MKSYVEFINIDKRFAGVRALNEVSFRADGGEICALMGENGAGKSTLLKIMSGALLPDSGEVVCGGETIEFKSPYEAIKKGVSIIYQERQLVGDLTVTENVFMEDMYKNKLGIVDFQRTHKEMQEILDEFKMPFNPKTKVNQLSVAHQQMVEIMKAYRRNSDVIAFDEPTASLSEQEITVLFNLINKLRDEGKTIIYVSHRLKEVFELADKIVILKDGVFVGEVPIEDATETKIVSMMVGREIGDLYQGLERNENIGNKILEVSNLTNKNIKDISFYVRKGEILGFSGLVGAGRSEVMQAVFGFDKITQGKIYLEGKEINIKQPRDAIDVGIGLCPEDRKEQGLVLGRSIKDNLTISILKSLSRNSVIDGKKEIEVSRKAVEKHRIKTPSIFQSTIELSGGNQQKTILGRWLLADLKLLILDEPTKGIDVGAKSEIYKMICELARSGLAIILISSELPEIINLCDRVIIMASGKIVGELGREELTEERILKLAMSES